MTTAERDPAARTVAEALGTGGIATAMLTAALTGLTQGLATGPSLGLAIALGIAVAAAVLYGLTQRRERQRAAAAIETARAGGIFRNPLVAATLMALVLAAVDLGLAFVLLAAVVAAGEVAITDYGFFGGDAALVRDVVAETAFVTSLLVMVLVMPVAVYLAAKRTSLRIETGRMRWIVGSVVAYRLAVLGVAIIVVLTDPAADSAAFAGMLVAWALFTVVLLGAAAWGQRRARRRERSFVLVQLFRSLPASDQEALIEMAGPQPGAAGA